MTALIIGTLIALAAVAFVLVPLFRDDAAVAEPRPVEPVPAARAGEEAVDALREIEFDRATGKLSDADYAALKSRYTAEALDAMRAADADAITAEAITAEAITADAVTADAVTPEASDLAEQAILRYRQRVVACELCGPRPEPGAAYCSSCGRYLPGRCSGCGAAVSEPAARFCGSCGKTLAA